MERSTGAPLKCRAKKKEKAPLPLLMHSPLMLVVIRALRLIHGPAKRCYWSLLTAPAACHWPLFQGRTAAGTSWSTGVMLHTPATHSHINVRRPHGFKTTLSKVKLGKQLKCASQGFQNVQWGLFCRLVAQNGRRPSEGGWHGCSSIPLTQQLCEQLWAPWDPVWLVWVSSCQTWRDKCWHVNIWLVV